MFDPQISHLLEKIKREFEDNPKGPTTNAMLHHTAILSAKLAEQSDKTSQSILRVTWALAALTAALLLFTAYLSYDTYLKAKNESVVQRTVNSSN